jgi:RimJ/RimL family protein N-acetyltransferase
VAQAEGPALAEGAVALLGITTDGLELRPLPAAAAAALPGSREEVVRQLGVELSPDWPQADLLDILPAHARRSSDQICWGIWVIVDRAEALVVGDAGFHGPPLEDGSVELGFSVVPSHRRRGHASAAAAALASWAANQPGVVAVVAGCDPQNEASARTLARAGFRRTGGDENELRWRLG